MAGLEGLEACRVLVGGALDALLVDGEELEVVGLLLIKGEDADLAGDSVAAGIKAAGALAFGRFWTRWALALGRWGLVPVDRSYFRHVNLLRKENGPPPGFPTGAVRRAVCRSWFHSIMRVDGIRLMAGVGSGYVIVRVGVMGRENIFKGCEWFWGGRHRGRLIPMARAVHDWQVQEMARRKANLASDPASGLGWGGVKQRVCGRYAGEIGYCAGSVCLLYLPRRRFSGTLKGMEVHFSPGVETQLQQVAAANGKDAEQLVKDVVARMLESQARFISGVQRGIEQADRGEFVEHKDVLHRIDRLLQS